ncbi:MAG: hypothetical protein JST84_10875 [Acidobacteria bacterium]|nr:hypothetical protein [Acidobacteriota bacterium]
MRTLTINRNQIDYAGTFERPVFSLVGNTCILEGLYDTFSRFGVTLSDFRLDTNMAVPAENGVNVFLKSLGQYRLKFDRVEWTVLNFVDEDFPRSPEVLACGEEWLRSVEENLTFKNHTFVYGAHCLLAEGTAKDFLLSLPNKSDLSLGDGLGNGLIFNWYDADIHGRFNLILDHSLSVKDGIFIQLICVIEKDGINYHQVLSNGQQSLNKVLDHCGLQFEQETEVVS